VVNKIIKSPSLRSRLGKNARRTVEEKFDWSVIIKKLNKYYLYAFEKTRKFEAKKLPGHITKQDIKREKKELQKKIGYF
jgi:hypothetical protein